MLTAIRIKEIREGLSLSQAKAAGLVGVTVNTWHRWEKGLASPHAHLEVQIKAMQGGTLSEDTVHAPFLSHLASCAECQAKGYRITRAKLEREWQG